jgi:prepilin-type processing-associated H-X9-DG protein
LLVVIAIIAILAAILFPVFAKAREKARQSTCANNTRQIILAIQMYMQDNDGIFPPKEGVWGVVNLPPKSLACPTYGVNKGNGYGFNAWIAGKSPTDPGMDEVQNIPVIMDSRSDSHLVILGSADIDGRHTNKATVAWGDGHISLTAPGSVPISALTSEELLGDQVARPWAGAYWKGFSNVSGMYSVPPPAGWVSPSFASLAGPNYYWAAINYYSGLIISGDNSYYGDPGPYPPYPGNPTEMYLRIPLNTANRGNPVAINSGWVLSLPSVRFNYAFQKATGTWPTVTPVAGCFGYSTMRVLDDSLQPIATFKLEGSGASNNLTYSINGTTLCSIANACVPASSWSQYPWNGWYYQYGGQSHSILLIATGGNIICSLSNPSNTAIAGLATVAQGPGNLTSPTWLEFIVSTQDTGPGLGRWRIMHQEAGGGINWGPDAL